MSGIGFSEVVILCLIGLIVLGPERLPRVANQIGGWLGQARRMTRVMKRQLEEELDLENSIKPNQPTTSEPTVSEPSKSEYPRKSPGPSVVQDTEEAESSETESDDVESTEVESAEAESSEVESANEHDDTYSPAHESDDVGSGVDDNELRQRKAGDSDLGVDDGAPDEPESDDAEPAAVAEPKASDDTKEKES